MFFVAEKKRQTSLIEEVTDIEKLKSEVLSFIEENQSFEGILSEVCLNIFGCSRCGQEAICTLVKNCLT